MVQPKSHLDRPTISQTIYVRGVSHTLIDLTILNLFAEHWKLVTIGSFTVSILAAVLLQVLLKATLALEHWVADYFHSKPGGLAVFLRVFSAGAILFLSKFVMLGAINIVFGDRVLFTGPLHGTVAFIVVVLAMVIAETVASSIYQGLANKNSHKTKGEI